MRQSITSHYSGQNPKRMTNSSMGHPVQQLDKQALTTVEHASNKKKKSLVEPMQTDVVQDHHRLKKKKYACFHSQNTYCADCYRHGKILPCVLLFAVLILCGVTATTLGVILSQKPAEKSKHFLAVCTTIDYLV